MSYFPYFMKVEFTHDFIKNYKKRFSSQLNLQKRFEERLKKFTDNPDEVILAEHALSGKLERFRAFSINGDVRVIYYIYKDTAYFVDIGTHNQVYGQ